MARSANIIVALLCIVCVLALCVAPYVDIPVTSLKALQAFLLLMFALAGAGLLVDSFLFSLSLFRRAIRFLSCTMLWSLLLPIQTSCVQQC